MKSTDAFNEAIKSYLDKRAQTDNLFVASYTKVHKNLDECISYILNEVKKSGQNAFTDDEIYSMAMHYYDEDDLRNINPVRNVVVKHSSEMESLKKVVKPTKTSKQERPTTLLPSLFDDL